MRRVEALTGSAALAYLRQAQADLMRACEAAHVTPDQLAHKVEQQAAQLARALKDIRELKTAAALGTGASEADSGQFEVGGFTVVVRQVADLDREALRSLADLTKSKLTEGVVFFAGPTADGRVSMVASSTPGAAKKAAAGALVKHLAPIVGGGGGGRPDFAEAGGKDPSKIADLLTAARTHIESLLRG